MIPPVMRCVKPAEVPSFSRVLGGSREREGVSDLSVMGIDDIFGLSHAGTWYGRVMLLFTASLGDRSARGVCTPYEH